MTRRQHRFLLMVAPLALALGWAGTAGATRPALKHCKVNLATCKANLATCKTNLSQSQANLGTCNTNLSLSEANLATCTNELAACEANASAFPATGQTTSFREDDDGDLEAGATLSYTDNNTGLEWEKKSDDGSIHDKDTSYEWENAFAVHVAGLNTAPCFAGFCDWRLPNIKELQSIVNYEVPFPGPVVSAAFNNSCDSGDTVTDGSCTAASSHWSSTTYAVNLGDAWGVDFGFGGMFGNDKDGNGHVRAVRGGSP